MDAKPKGARGAGGPINPDKKDGRRRGRPVSHSDLDARAQLEAYRAALDAAAIVAITDPKGNITYANDKFCEISKYRRDELIGQDHRILNSGYHPKQFIANLWKTITAGQVWHGDLRNRAKDGSLYWVATTIVPFLDEAGEPYQFVAIRTEITQRKLMESALEHSIRDLALATERERQRAEALVEARDRLEELNRRIREEQSKLIQAEKLSSIGLLAAGIAHEINNPLSGVMGCLKALEGGALPEPRRAEYFHTAREGLERIQQTVRGLLSYARRDKPRRGHVDAAEVIEASVRLVEPAAHHKDVHIVSSVQPGAVTLSADRTALMQALINLMLNAVYASPRGLEVRVSTIEDEGRVGFVVRDQGAGMPSDVARRATDPFFTTKPEGEGTGLGLAVTLSIARSHGGDLDLDTVEGQGTAVTLWIGRGQEASDATNLAGR
ncbi:MAG: PAS domain-containing sensor histidine kinase [Deltaproteobacteria bacterium]|nr:PAS domain-containing sensor histidine kinase [Deltaproteobacteria bacterium]